MCLYHYCSFSRISEGSKDKCLCTIELRNVTQLLYSFFQLEYCSILRVLSPLVLPLLISYLLYISSWG